MGYYEYDYGFEPSAGEAIGGAVGAVFGFFLVFYLLMLAFGVACYVLQSLGFYTIAKRRGIRNPWLSWLPVGNMWILGSISDQYQYVAKGRVRNKRKALLGLMLAMYLALTLIWGGAFVSILSEAMAMDASEVLLGATLGGVLIAYLVLLVISVTAIVFEYMALYDLYVSCEPSNGVLYLVLSIFVGVVLPFFVFACRKKDLGMPPRKPVQPEIPEAQPVEEPIVEEMVEPVAEEQEPAPAEEAEPAAEQEQTGPAEE